MRRLLRTARGVSKDPRLPRWVRFVFLLALLPIPGPFDELVGVVGVTVLVVRHRALLVEHWVVQGLQPAVHLDTWGAWA